MTPPVPDAPSRARIAGLAVLALIACLLTLAVPAGAPAAAVSPAGASAAAAWTAPAFVRSIGARGNAGLYAWGAAYNAVTDEIIVGDYMNYQLRRFDRQGRLLGSFYRPPGQRRGHPESVAVDPRDGAIYTSDRSRDDQGYIAKFDKTGAFLSELRIEASYHAWVTVDAAGFLYVSDSHVGHDASRPPQVRKYAVDDAAGTATEVAHWGSYGTGPGQIHQITGIAVATDGTVYTADTLNRTVHAWAADGTWLRDIGSGGAGPGQFLGDLRGVAVSGDGSTLYVVDAEAEQVERYALPSGESLGSFGSSGTGAGQFGDGGRQLTVDAGGHVWVADFGNTRVMEFTATGEFVAALPQPDQAAPAGGFSLPRDVAVDPATGDVLAVEMNNHRFQRFAADGAPIGTWGRRSTDRPLGFNYPRGIAVDPASGRIWVANTNQDSVRVLNPDLTLAFEIGGEHGTEPGQFKNPMDIEYHAGRAYVSDYAGGRMKVLDAATGTELWYIEKSHSGVAVDPATGDIYLSSWQTDAIWHYRPDGTPGTPAKFGSRGTGPGQFQNGWDIDVSGGVVYATDSDRAKVIAYTPTGQFLGEWGSPGTKPGQFNNLSGITHDASGRIYVADAGNDRVQVFDPAAVQPPDATAPSVTVTAPAGGATIPAPVTLSGAVTDDVRVGTVEVAVQDRVTKKWWDGKVSTWVSGRVFTTAGVTGGSPTAQSWWFPLIGAAHGGSYYAVTRATDAAGNTSPVTGSRTFRVATATPPDTTAPDSTITTPAYDAAVPSGTVTISGSASDDTALAAVQVAVQDRSTKRWWNHVSSAWQTSQSWAPASLGSSGTAASSWSYDFQGAAPGGYFATARARDAAGNLESTRPATRFTATP